MKLGKWRIEYTVTLLIALTLLLLSCPFSFKSTVQANNISKWKTNYNKIEYAHDAIFKQAQTDLLKGIRQTKISEQKEHYMLLIIKPYFRLTESKMLRNYKVKYMNKNKVKPKDFYYIDDYYLTDDNIIVGIKDIPNAKNNEITFIMTFDVNGLLPPNQWGKDVFGVYFYTEKVEPLGKELPIEKQHENCSPNNEGTACSNYYLIGGNFDD